MRARTMLVMLALVCAADLTSAAQSGSLDELLDRVGVSVARFIDQLGSVRCTEEMLQEKIDPKGKSQERLLSSFDYLVLQQNQGNEPLLYEARQAVKQGHAKKNVSMLVSNGFATELLIFHPFYQPSFTFKQLPSIQSKGKTYAQIHFAHVRGRPTPAALELRGRD